ncbi:MAG TPA: methyltransferase domain-containing protein [Candidatus Binataceae bacterium]|nr:methyltransferase domain-containing protein [Candidatus Binataceae bacterium]
MANRSLGWRIAPRLLALAVVVAVTLGAGWSWAQQTTMPRATGQVPLQARIKMLENPQRDQTQKPVAVLKALNLKPGMTVADIGAGSGYFTRRFARAVGPTGKVYAVDISSDILGYVKARAKKEGMNNIQTVLDKPDDPMLPASSVDLAFLSDVSHHIDHRTAFYTKIYQALKPDGRMAIIDFPPQAHNKGWCPHQTNELVPAWENIREAQDAGFKLDRTYDFLPHSYFLVFDKGDQWPAGAQAVGK